MERLTGKEITKVWEDWQSSARPSRISIYAQMIAQAQLDKNKADCGSCKKQIFEEIEILNFGGATEIPIVISTEKWQALKQKHLGDSKEEK